MRVPNSSRYLRLIFILFIDILIYLKVLKNTLKFHSIFRFRRHRRENQRRILKVKLINFMLYKLEFIFIKTL